MNQTNNEFININNHNRNNNKWFLMLCELQAPSIHGPLTGEPNYLVYDWFDGLTGISLQDLENITFDFDTDDEYDSDTEMDDGIMTINKTMRFLKDYYSQYDSYGHPEHPIIRNYSNIISRENYIRPEIGEYIMLPTLESVAILKTFWLRIIQRTWKNIFKKRQNIIKLRTSPSSLRVREITGDWQLDLVTLPGLRGMLNNLK